MRRGPGRRTRRDWAPALLGVVVTVVLLSAWEVPPIVPALVALAACVTVLLALGAHRPKRWSPWALIALSQGLCSVSSFAAVAAGGRSAPATTLLVAAQLASAVLALHVLRVMVGRPRPPGGGPAARLDALIVAVVVALAAAHALAAGAGQGGPSPPALTPALNLVLMGLVLRLLVVSATSTAAVLRLQLAGLSAALSYLLASLPGARGHLAAAPLEPGLTVTMALLAWAATHPSMVLVFEPASLGRRRHASTQMLAALPLVAVPPCLWLLDGSGAAAALPTAAYLLVGALVAGLALLRGALALRASERRAAHDPLTDLLNRRGLAQAFATRQRRGAGAGGWVLCLLDVDDFKHVNDTYGHDVGDALILEVARRLARAVGPADAVARTGGDEFVLLLAAGPGHRAPEDVLAAAFGQPFPVAGRLVAVRASTGTTPVPDGSSMLQLLADADVAMYAAKAAGGGTVAFSEDLRRQVLGRRALVEDLRAVLAGGEAERVGGLHVLYQPLVDLGSSRVLACEALVRWRHPARGLVMPDDMLGAAEEHGLGRELDRLVLRAALAQLVRWDGAGLPPLSVSVNLGRSSTCHPGLALDVLDALAKVGLPASRLRLEITEHEHLPDDPAIAEEFQALVAAGVGLSLDDFGAGYASLDYLLRYPVSTLKLDRCLTASLIDQSASPLLEGVVGLAARLGLTVLAEGVETAEQRERLAGLGIDHGQGWYFARPLGGDDFAGHVLGRAPAPVLPAG
ncbi:putative bifunctional diguanylate cyclase/phosphodiesterase [Kineococcus xinjiangensis]|uniref:putative bifunctional diguanylate cyclase/phosphodiesterase n=1 Tax=Kineococcus xinjiangensis TaxID=512762 RepID=UPI0011B0EB41|nr:bifunctional diguanylate cyclase/phosphodiesterase [Kineococcus xinjiangensis]